jgi:hypothetical protein
MLLIKNINNINRALIKTGAGIWQNQEFLCHQHVMT